MDLGSAVLSAELALELLDDDVRDRVVLCPAPLVEGLVVAAVAAAGRCGPRRGGGARRRAPSRARRPTWPRPSRRRHRRPGVGRPGELTGAFTVANPHGLHARPAARVVQAVRAFDARVAHPQPHHGIGVGARGQPVEGGHARRPVPATTSRSGRAATRPARRSTTCSTLAARDFDEPLDGPARRSATMPARPPARPAVGRGSGPPDPAVPGIGIGPAWSPRLAPIDLTGIEAGDPAVEWRGLTESIAAVRRSVSRVRARATRDVGEAEAAIFDAHLLLLDDADLLGDVRARVDGGRPPPPPGPRPSTRSRATWPTCPTPTCGPAPRTSPPCGTQCCASCWRVAPRRHRAERRAGGGAT